MAEWTPPAVGAPVWIAIPATDVAASKAFYSAVLSWEFKPLPAGYNATEIAMFSFPGLPNIGGGINRVDKMAHTPDAVSLNHYMVESIDKTQEKIVELGGKVLLETTPEGKYGLVAKYQDPQGAQFAVYQMVQ